MTLYGTILKKVQSKESISKKYSSPPPETETVGLPKKKKKYVYQYGHVPSRVDSRPPKYDARAVAARLPSWARQNIELDTQNLALLTQIKMHHYMRGKVDSRWSHYPRQKYCQSYHQRKNFMARTERENKLFYQILVTTESRVVPTSILREDWKRNRKQIIEGALNDFVLFDPNPKQQLEDIAFLSADGVKRPRVHLTLGVAGGASLGSLVVELFSDVCPLTCGLFLTLATGDGLGHSYIGTKFYTKATELYWAGGDVIHDNGFGCYAERGRTTPIGAENYHFPHSMPGLLSMRMTRNNEMCGLFNITFKPLPQFDLKNVVFGRVIRPSSTYDIIRKLGAPLASRPVVVITGTRRYDHDTKQWVHGEPNTRIKCMRC